MITPKMLGLLAVAFVAGSFVASPELRAYAAATIGSADIIDNSIQSVDVKDGEVKTPDLANNAVTSTKIKDGEVKTDDIAPGAIGSLRIKDNDVKTQDIANGAVTKVKLGSDVLDTIIVINRYAFSSGIASGGAGTTTASCLSGEVATGGGYNGNFVSSGLDFERSFPNSSNGWTVDVDNPSGSTQYYYTYVVCTKLSP